MPDNEDKEDQGVPVAQVHITDKESGEELGVVTLPGVTPDEPEEEIEREGLKAFQRFKAAEDSLDPDFIEGAAKHFPADTLLDLAALELTKRVVQAYCEKLEAVLNDQGVQAVDTSLPHLRPATDDEGNATVEIVLEDKDFDKIHASHRELLNDLEDPSVEFGRFAWTHIVAWATDLIEEDIGPEKVEAMTDQEFDSALNDYIFDRNPEPFSDRLGLLANVWAEGLGRMLVDTVDPASRSLKELEALMGLRSEKAPVPLEPALFEVADYVRFSTASVIRSTQASIAKPGKWAPNEEGVLAFTYRPRTGTPITHTLGPPPSLGTPTDKLDPRFARVELLDKGGVYTMRLNRALAAHALKHGSGETFYLDGDYLIQELGLKGRKDLKHGEKLRLVNDHAGRLAYWRVEGITREDFKKRRGKTVKVTRTREDHVWHIKIEREYEQTLFQEGDPELARLILEVTPGEWGRIFLDRAAGVLQYGWTTAPQLNPWTHNLAARLEEYLLQMCAINRGRLPWAVTVGHLLDMTLEGALKRSGSYYDLAALRTGRREDRREVMAQWDEAMLALKDQGWSIDFDPGTYPEEIRPAWALEDPEEEAHREKRRRPKGYWDKLMKAKVLVSPTPDIAALYDKGRKPPKKRLPPAPTITGDQVKAAREKAGLTQGQLAKKLGRSRPWVSLIESGQRNIGPQDAEGLKRELGL